MKQTAQQFVVYPEYAWPIRSWRVLLEHATRDLPTAGACIAPFEHLTRAEYEQLLRDLPVEESIRARELDELVPNQHGNGELVNVCVALIRANSGSIVAIPQRKLRAAALEEGRLLAGTRRVVIKGTNCSFAILICFDMIALDPAFRVRPRDLLPHDERLDFVFAPECNPGPFHAAYAHAIIDLFQKASWSGRPPFIAFANVPLETRLPGGGGYNSIGFSRVVGKLGRVSHPGGASTHLVSGVVAHSAPRSLKDLAESEKSLPVHSVEWVIARPQPSAMSVTVPLDGASNDPAAGRTDVSARLYRWVKGWQLVRSTRRLTVPLPRYGVPTQLIIAKLIDAEDARTAFVRALHRSSQPIWIIGGPGSGKTALAATVLHEHLSSDQRVLWVDADALEKEPHALAESLLLRLGLVAGTRTAPKDQWRSIRVKLEEKPTVVVVDSYERWKQELPSQLLDMHGWPVRVVVTSRKYEADLADVAPDALIQVQPLSTKGVREMLWAGKPPRTQRAQTFEKAAAGVPLACVWLSRLPKLRLAKRGATSALERIFAECTSDLAKHELQLLQLVAKVPAPMTLKTAAMVLDCDSVEHSLRRLRERHLVTLSNDDEPSLQPAHPLVRQLAPGVAWNGASKVDAALVAWAERRLREDGGDRNWHKFESLACDWENLRFVLERQLAETDEALDIGLAMWRDTDYFLWSTGRLRERERFGRLVRSVATKPQHRRYLAHALIDAIAETIWHRDPRRNAVEAEALLKEASKLVSTDASMTDERIQLTYYRARFAQKREKFDEAERYARQAASLAGKHNNPRLHGHALNTMGNVLRAQQRFDEALMKYDAAEGVLASIDAEMVAIVHRQRGRCLLLQDQLREAIEHLETAMELLDDLKLTVERAEAGIHHAVALALAGEKDDAIDEFDDVERFFSASGLAMRLAEIEEARRKAKLPPTA